MKANPKLSKDGLGQYLATTEDSAKGSQTTAGRKEMLLLVGQAMLLAAAKHLI